MHEIILMSNSVSLCSLQLKISTHQATESSLCKLGTGCDTEVDMHAYKFSQKETILYNIINFSDHLSCPRQKHIIILELYKNYNY